MFQKKIPLINSAHGSDTRNIINELIKLFNGMGYTYDESLRKAKDILNEAERVNKENVSTQKQVDELILHAGESDAEVIQARGGLPLLKDRLDESDAQLAQNMKQQQTTPTIQPYEALLEPYREVQIHDGDNNIYATYSRTGENPTFEKSTDFGKTWVAKGVVPARCQSFTKVSKTGTIIAIEQVSTLAVNNPRMWRSADDGDTWTLINAGLRFPPLGQQGVTDTPSGAICVGEYGNVGNTSYRIMRSTDDGLTWNEVLSSPGTDPWGDPGHYHSITFDPYTNKLITFMDRPANQTYGARIYESADDGATWELLGVVDSNTKPNFVSPMYFETHIAWGSDNERNGIISRIKRSDFYSGAFNKVEDIAFLNDKAFYFTFPLREGVWVVSMANETVAAATVPDGPGNYANEIFVVSDNGKVVSGGITHFQINSNLGSLTGNKIIFPSYKFDRLDHKGLSWLNIVSGRPRPYATIPYSQGVSLPTTNIALPTTIPLANMQPLQGKRMDDSLTHMISVDNQDNVIIRNGISNNAATIRLRPDGELDILRNNRGTFYTKSNDRLLIPRLDITTNGIGFYGSSGDPNGSVSAPSGSICLNWNRQNGVGGWIKKDGSGNTGWLPIIAADGGPSDGRPTAEYTGMTFFDTSINKPIWWNGSAWVDATGTTV